MTTTFAWNQWKEQRPRPAVLWGWALLIGAVAAACWGPMRYLETSYWRTNPDYGHCYAVPVFAGVLLWLRREMLQPLPTRGSWWGLAFLALATLLRWASVLFAVLSFGPLSLIPLFAGIAVLLGGWRALRWSWPSIAFLVFMLHLPGFLESGLRYPLQRTATIVSTFLIQTVGIPAIAEGNKIQLAGGPIEVAAVCSGLRMLMLFFAMCVGAAFVIRGPLWERIIPLASAVPIAILANVARITLTGISHEVFGAEWTDQYAHTPLGLLMPAIGLGLLMAEMYLLRRLLPPPPPEKPLMLTGAFPGFPRQAPAPRRGAPHGRRSPT